MYENLLGKNKYTLKRVDKFKYLSSMLSEDKSDIGWKMDWESSDTFSGFVDAHCAQSGSI